MLLRQCTPMEPCWTGSGNLSACMLLKVQDLLQVVLFERGFTGQLAFQAHGHQVSQLICLRVRLSPLRVTHACWHAC